jgi:hypothetical protein
MPVRGQEMQSIQAAISVSEMARRLTLSRGRFYELVKDGIFPRPLYCIHSRRALYSPDLQQICLEVRATNVGLNGTYILFYGPRTVTEAPPASPRGQHRSNNRINRPADPALAALREGLASLGLSAIADSDLQSALRSAYPAGVEGVDAGTVLATVFRLLRRPNPARLSPES